MSSSKYQENSYAKKEKEKINVLMLGIKIRKR